MQPHHISEHWRSQFQNAQDTMEKVLLAVGFAERQRGGIRGGWGLFQVYGAAKGRDHSLFREQETLRELSVIPVEML